MRTAGIITALISLVVGFQAFAQNGGYSDDSYSAPATSSGYGGSAGYGASTYHVNRSAYQEPLFQLTPVVGVTYSNFSGGSNGYSFSSTAGYEAGMDALIGRGDLRFETGLIYAERGAKESYSPSYSTYLNWSETMENQYLEIPLMANYRWQTSRDMHFFVKAGLVVAMLQSASGSVSSNSAYYNGYTSAYTQTYGKSPADYFNSTDVRWAVGLGTDVRITRSMSWMISADYEASVSNVSTSQPDAYGNVNNMSLTLNSYSLNTGLIFSL